MPRVDEGWAVIAGRGKIVIVVRNSGIVVAAGRVRNWLVKVFTSQTETVGRQFIVALLRVVLARAVCLEFARHAIDG